MALPKSIRTLSDNFSSLPGIGPKLSYRIALYLAISRKDLANRLDQSLKNALEEIKQCPRCFNVTDKDLCEICDSDDREEELVMIVESPLDLYSIEETDTYKGVYHVLNGVISPVNGVGPDDLKISELFERLKKSEIKEIIFGLNPDLEGDSTTLFIKNHIENMGLDREITFTRLAKGIPTGSSIEYMSSQTLSESLKSRSEI